jgi:signal peptidase I
MAGDNLLVNRMYGEPKRGDIIVFEFPGFRDQIEPDEFQYYIKRCVAIAGDTLEVSGRKVLLNGLEQPLPPNVKFEGYDGGSQDRFRTFPEGAGFTRDNWGPMRVPKRGDVIPLNDSTFYMYRVFIMREGHRIEQQGERFVIDGKTVASYTVERDYCFGMGDNRDNSLDSRYWGFIPVENVAGKAWMVLWSSAGSDRTFKKVE